MTKYFVWMHGTKGPVPQIWYDKPTDGNGKAKPSLASPVALEESDARTIEQLMAAYPIEAV